MAAAGHRRAVAGAIHQGARRAAGASTLMRPNSIERFSNRQTPLNNSSTTERTAGAAGRRVLSAIFCRHLEVCSDRRWHSFITVSHHPSNIHRSSQCHRRGVAQKAEGAQTPSFVSGQRKTMLQSCSKCRKT